MKVLYFGGQKSGKSNLSEKKAIELSTTKPYYIATYDNSYVDDEMQKRVSKHQQSREDSFITIEEPKDLTKIIKSSNTYLVDCLSMWLLNNIDLSEDELVLKLEELSKINANIIFVLNDVTRGVIPLDKLSREYVDKTGIIGQKVASFCDEVYEVKLGLGIQLK